MVNISLNKGGKASVRSSSLEIRELKIKGFETVIEGVDKKSGLHCFIALHSTLLGPALGGARIYPYKNREEALEDVLRLSEAMTYKSAIAKVGLGGGKSVIIADPHKDKSPELFSAFAEVINYLEGQYIVAEDVGSTPHDMTRIQKKSPYVSCIISDKSSGDPSHFTAWGAFKGIEATLLHMYGSSSLSGKTVALQGLGHVGSKLVKHLFWHGAKVLVSDVDEEKLEYFHHTFGAEVVFPSEIYRVPCDIFSPCAMGGVINQETIPLLKCRAVAGCANNQLQTVEDGIKLKEKGILYAPDFIINSGGLINAVAEFEPGGYNALSARDKTIHIKDVLLDVFQIAEKEDKSTGQVAEELAKHYLKHEVAKRESQIEFEKR